MKSSRGIIMFILINNYWVDEELPSFTRNAFGSSRLRVRDIASMKRKCGHNIKCLKVYARCSTRTWVDPILLHSRQRHYGGIGSPGSPYLILCSWRITVIALLLQWYNTEVDVLFRWRTRTCILKLCLYSTASALQSMR